MAAAFYEPALVVVAGVPLVHAFEHVFRLVNRDDGAFGQDFQLGVGDDGRNFQDNVLFGLEARHFQVHPDEIVGTFLFRHDKSKFNILPLEDGRFTGFRL